MDERITALEERITALEVEAQERQFTKMDTQAIADIVVEHLRRGAIENGGKPLVAV